VLLVVLYHLKISVFPGGFIGVDVFFVISGFLITRMIWDSADDFSLSEFYLRRARRLFPAAAVTIVSTVVIAWFILGKPELIATMKSALLAMVSFSNFGFWLEAGYWDSESILKPLLHTWSLGVEEQFYLIWPFLILGIFSIPNARQHVFSILVVISIAGVIASEWAVRTYPSAAFYLMPFRITEFALGAIYVFAERRFRRYPSGRIAALLFVSGLLAILAAAILYDSTTSFPGIASWLPCLGAVAVIAAGKDHVFHRLLTNAVSTFLGRMSYSLYLVHWPIIVFTGILFGPDFDSKMQALLLISSLITAFSLYILIETPFRVRRTTARTTNPIRGGVLMMCMALVLTLGISHGIFNLMKHERPVQIVRAAELNRDTNPDSKSKTTETAINYLSPQILLDQVDYNLPRFDVMREICPTLEDEICLVSSEDKLNILVIGDSQGVDGVIASQAAMPNAHIIPGGRGGCAPLISIDKYFDQVGIYTSPQQANECLTWNKTLFSAEGIIPKADIVVVSMFWRPVRIEFFDETILRIKNLNPDVPILLLGNGTILKRGFSQIAADISLDRGAVIPEKFIYPMTFSLDTQVVELAERYEGVYLASRNAFVCPGNKCAVYTPSGRDFVTYDRVHFSATASREFGQAVLRPWLERFQLGRPISSNDGK